MATGKSGPEAEGGATRVDPGFAVRGMLVGMVMTLVQLRHFLAAVERGSVSGAAEACFVSQPSLSEQLRRLEHGLGVA